ncbi:hypothetical protein [Pseudomonas akapageensis]|uniref:hypothetical protein n=1 Tax=Pseudomonas akapageensis TaxID=2609961 RepID=UPI001409643A|nr:hypothetical protein [Pseudomonas akapageensis]
MNILVSASNQGSQWQVRLDQHVVNFRSEAEARAFVSTLQARLTAPHPIPQLASANLWPTEIVASALRP